MKFKNPSLEWLEKPNVFGVNRIPAHSDHHYFQSWEEVRIGKTTLKQSLNGSWKITYAKHPSLRLSDFYKEDFDTSGFDFIEVPGHIQTQGYDRNQYVNTMYPWDGQEFLRPPQVSKNYNPVASYVKYFEVNEALLGKQIFISFQGVETAFYVWLNGTFLGYGEDSFTPTEFEITRLLKEGGNKLAVEVYKRSSASWIEDQDFWRFSGIFRDVYLYAIPSVHIDDLFVRSDLMNCYQDGRLRVKAHLIGDLTDVVVETSLFDACNQLVFKGKLSDLETGIELKNVKVWSAENPYLYNLELQVKKNTELIEVVIQKLVLGALK